MGRGYNDSMESVALVVCVVATLWLVSVLSFLIYFWVKVMPVIRELQKTAEGQLTLSKLVFPPRFRR
jgi:hypothetical protein